MDKQYSFADKETKMYKLWERSGGFSPSDDDEAEPYCIIMPPPNANDPLHIGHAMFVAIEDVLIRVARMQGKAALWLPGTDHAGIETQYVFEKKLAKEGKSRFDFDRKSLYKAIWEYVQENSGVAIEQMKKLGASADWSRQKFTLDEDVVAEVLQTFVKMYEDGLVYRDLRLVNYCTKCGTGYSELEVNSVEEEGFLWRVKYELVEPVGDIEFIEVATTRPETLFGDVAVAVHPEDERWKKLVGKRVKLPLVRKEVEIIADEMVDPEFGTGLVKITPYHDLNDFEVWQRHKDQLPEPKQVIEFNWKLNEHTGEFSGLNVVNGRKKVLERLEEEGLLMETKKHRHSVGRCYRCNRVIEPLPLTQFFIQVKSLTQKALEALDEGQVRVCGAGHDKILRHWLEHLRDWNISRQIVWGIRMPVWYQADLNHEVEVGFLKEGEFVRGKIGELLEKYSLEEIKEGLQTLRAPGEAKFVVSPTPPGDNYIQETDTFDTWFSSSQWPFVTLMSDENPKSEIRNPKKGLSVFSRFYPTTVMETAYDILMFWVMRMLMMGLYRTGKVPFKNVYLHGLIRDQKGQKMSKSKGNVVNPVEVIEKYGADSLRMALMIRSSAGLDKNVGENDIRAMRNLGNKIWNAARFILLSHESRSMNHEVGEVQKFAKQDREFRDRLNKIVDEVTRQIEDFKIGLAADTVYNQFWHWFCDECIESNKKRKISDMAILEGLVVFLKLLHPFAPFVTEATWQELREEGLVKEKMLMNSSWPRNSG